MLLINSRAKGYLRSSAHPLTAFFGDWVISGTFCHWTGRSYHWCWPKRWSYL